jgi:hypothetical protein
VRRRPALFKFRLAHTCSKCNLVLSQDVKAITFRRAMAGAAAEHRGGQEAAARTRRTIPRRRRIAVRRDADRLCIDRSQCDTCPASSPKDASKIAEALTQAPRKEIVYMESAAIQGQPCEAESPHSYLGIEQATVERIAEWIAAMSRQ